MRLTITRGSTKYSAGTESSPIAGFDLVNARLLMLLDEYLSCAHMLMGQLLQGRVRIV